MAGLPVWNVFYKDIAIFHACASPDQAADYMLENHPEAVSGLIYVVLADHVNKFRIQRPKAKLEREAIG